MYVHVVTCTLRVALHCQFSNPTPTRGDRDRREKNHPTSCSVSTIRLRNLIQCMYSYIPTHPCIHVFFLILLDY